jgi:predicted transcriptional regulator
MRLSELTKGQIGTLAETTGMKQTEIVSVAIDRMFREETNVKEKQMTANEIVTRIIENGRVATNEELEVEFEFDASEQGWTDEKIKAALESTWFPWIK